MTNGYLLLPSGGLRYHSRAVVGKRRWAPFVERLARWLREDWAPAPGRPLLLVGSSAGWCLPLTELAALGFSRVVAADLDPLALWLLRRRLRAVAPTLPYASVVVDALGVTDDPPGARLARLLDTHGRSAPGDAGPAHVLFCNVWGQQIFQVDDDRAFSRFVTTLPALLAGWSWASFFDRLSGPVVPRLDDGNERSVRSLPDDALLERFYPRARTPPTRIELVDHGTEHVFVDRPRVHLHWHLRRGQHHLVEAVCSQRDE